MKPKVARPRRRRVPVVVRQRLVSAPVAAALVAVALITAAAGGYWWGWQRGAHAHGNAVDELRRQRALTRTDQHRIARLEQRTANAEASARLDQAAAEEVRTSLLKQKRELAELREQIGFYRSLMAPGAEKHGLSVRSLAIWEADDPRRFRFSLVIQQLAKKHAVLSGQLHFSIEGDDADGHSRVLALKDVSDEYDSGDIKLRFKYFQNIAGVIELPEHYRPRSVHVVAHAGGKNRIDQRFSWQVEN